MEGINVQLGLVPGQMGKEMMGISEYIYIVH